MRQVVCVSALLAAALLAGCGGGGGSTSQSTTTTTTATTEVSGTAVASTPAPTAQPPGTAPDMSSLAAQPVTPGQLPVLSDGQWRLTSERGTSETCVSDAASRMRWNFIADLGPEGRNCQTPQYSRTGNIYSGAVRCENVSAMENAGGDFNNTVSVSVEITENGREAQRLTLLMQRVGECATN